MPIRILIIIATIFWGKLAHAQTTIEIIKPDCQPIVCGSAVSIYIDGKIGEHDAERLEYLVLKGDLSIYSTVYLNSPGGSLFGGLELGRIIRKYEFNTAVGKLLDNGEHSQNDTYCMSACTLAFLGGEFRYFTDSSLFGVHRFYSDQPIANEGEKAQIASGQIIAFLEEMEIESDFFVEMTKSGSESMRILKLEQLIRLGIVNNGLGSTNWTITAAENSTNTSFLYLKGERNTSYGVNKILFFCAPSGKGVGAHVIFDPQGRHEEAQAMKAISLEIDDTQYPFSEHLLGETKIVNGWLNASFLIPINAWSSIKNAKTIGFIFQSNYEAPVFLGISGMSLKGSRKLMIGIEKSCASTANTPTDSTFEHYQNTDFFGADLTKTGIKGVSLSDCEDICELNKECTAYSYIQSKRWCFPKSIASQPIKKLGVLSGHK